MSQMTAVRIHRFGGPEVLESETVARPAPGSGEMLVRVRAASVNPVDFKIRSGDYPMVKTDQLPMTLGRDLAGTVETLGEDTTGFREGDEVFAFLAPDRGAYADFVLVKADEAAAQPGDTGFEEAAAVPLAGLTAWQGLFDHGGLTQGQRVLIHGGAGGVGHLAIQFAKSKGAEVLTTASAEDKAWLEELGADRVIDYKSERFEDLAQDIDIVFDLIGGETQQRSWSVLKSGGILVSTLGEPKGGKDRSDFKRGVGYLAQPSSAQLGEIAELIDAGKVHVRVQSTYPLDHAAQAQSELEKQHVRGKIVLKVD